MTIKIADMADFEFLALHDKHISTEELKNSIELKRIYIMQVDGINIGWLRYNLFWDNTPFMNMLFLLDSYKNKGYGKKIVSRWEHEMRNLGYSMVMTSTLANESAQHFYRKLSYKDSGALFLENEATEIIFTKAI